MLRKVKLVIGYRLSVIAKEIFLCILSASLLSLSFPKFNLEFLAWVGFVPLFFALEGKSKGKAFLVAYISGVIFWFGIVYWLVHVTLLGMFLLVLYLALYFGVFGYLISFFSMRYALYVIPSIWVILEYLRSHLFSGFPWALLGYSQYLNLPIIQIADITGAWGVSFLVMAVNVSVYRLLTYVRLPFTVFSRLPLDHRNYKHGLSILLFSLLVALGYGYYRLHDTRYTIHDTRIKISVIQGNIPQELKWNPRSKDFIMNRYFALTLRVAEDKPDLIIWPEAALPVVLEEEPLYYERVVNFVKDIRVPLLFGAVTSSDSSYYNRALFISDSGKLLNRYDKLHLVPFGEYIPLRRILRFLETVVPIGDFTPGKEYTIFQIPNPKTLNNFAVLICFEDLFPQISRSFVTKGAGFLVNITNDAWFSKTSSPYQHLQASVFRAVENRVNLVRSANTGVSGFIAPSGKIISLVQDDMGRNIFIDGYKTREILIPERRLSFYTRYGDVFIVTCFLFLLYGIIRNLKTQNSKAGKAQNALR